LIVRMASLLGLIAFLGELYGVVGFSKLAIEENVLARHTGSPEPPMKTQ